MPVKTLQDAISEHTFRPKGIKVSPDLWKELSANGKIKWKRGYFKGVIDSEIDLPWFDEDIFVHTDPDLESFDFTLPED